MIQENYTELLLNASRITHQNEREEVYEFVINHQLKVTECVRLGNKTQTSNQNLLAIPTQQQTQPQVQQTINKNQIIIYPHLELQGYLFELNHVRINPRLDNTLIIQKLTEAFAQVGVQVKKTPAPNSMQTCYKPLGEITANIRFYIQTENNLVFLSPDMRPKVITTKNAQAI